MDATPVEAELTVDVTPARSRLNGWVIRFAVRLDGGKARRLPRGRTTMAVTRGPHHIDAYCFPWGRVANSQRSVGSAEVDVDDGHRTVVELSERTIVVVEQQV